MGNFIDAQINAMYSRDENVLKLLGAACWDQVDFDDTNANFTVRKKIKTRT